MYNIGMKISNDMPLNVSFAGYSKSKSGKTLTIWEVECLNCNKKRKVKRADHAKSHAGKNCKFCSNKKNHPQGDHRGIRISFFNKYCLSAKSRSLNWSITIDDAADLAEFQLFKCALSGIPLIFNGDFNQITASLDRIDNSKGYEIGNIQWVHKEINMLRGTLSIDRFIELCEFVVSSKVL
jgi:hypothetical protein